MKLFTDLGIREAYDAVSQCNRCGYCAQACPTYVATGREAFSGRGRNQLVRMMMEGKLGEPASPPAYRRGRVGGPGRAGEAFSTCLLCGACTSACFARVPTSDLVLEGCRAAASGPVHPLVRFAFFLLEEHSGWFRRLLRLAHLAKRAGLARMAAAVGIFRLLGLRVVGRSAEYLRCAPLRFFCEDPLLIGGRGKDAYFAACGTNYLYPEVGRATLSVLSRFGRPLSYRPHSCCGLLEYNYGLLEKARELARRNIQIFEPLFADESFVVVADCSSCAAFLKSYPRLFLEDPNWLSRAEKFSSRVRDAVELIHEAAAEQGIRFRGAWPLLRPRDTLQSKMRDWWPHSIRPGAPKSIEKKTAGNYSGRVTYHDSCRARHGQGIFNQPRDILKRLDGVDFVELTESDSCCGGAGAFGFLHAGLSEKIAERKVACIRKTGARTVLTSSTSCLIQLGYALKKYHPECRVMHLSQFLNENRIFIR